ncbi:MAG: 4Fe-4S dicluster domain-containing protein [Anaerolineales bacterium]
MTVRADPNLLLDLKKFGAVGIEQCFNCGNCTAICPLTNDEHPFPRNMIRLAQMGLKDSLRASTDPWLCYYCGDCSATCPRGAEPGETMMAIRRWLTAQYDRTGHGTRLYTSEKAIWWTIARIALITLAFFVGINLLGPGRIETEQVALNQFAPALLVWGFVVAHFAYLGTRVLSGIVTMFKSTMASTLRLGKIPLGTYLSEFKTLIIHFFTQKRWVQCSTEKPPRRWLVHMLLVSGYLTMLTLVVGLLWWFQTDEIYPLHHPQRWLGYYATIVLIYASTDMLIGRIRKRDQMHRFSHPSDWLFPAFILFGSVSGILVHILRYAGLPWPTYFVYIIHVLAMVAMLDTEVGIGKWAHLIYRPLALYLEGVKTKVRQQREVAVGAAAPAD